jgi:hypothetical protein
MLEMYIWQIQIYFVLRGHAPQHKHQLLQNNVRACVPSRCFVCNNGVRRDLLGSSVGRLLHEHLEAGEM